MQKRLFTILWCCALILLILFFPDTALSSASSAISSWLNIVLPSLLPFCIATSLLEECGAVAIFARRLQPLTTKVFGFSGVFSYAFLASCLSGYPMGAKITSESYANGQLTQDEATEIINCTSTSGPMFLVGAVCIGMLGDSSMSKYLLLPHYLSALILAISAGRRFRKKRLHTGSHPPGHISPPHSVSFGVALSRSVAKGLDSMLAVGGFMVIYAVFAQCLLALFRCLPIIGANQTTRQLLSLGLGALEMTTGCIHSDSLPLFWRLLYLNAIISFGGFCIHSQTAAICAKNGVPIRHLFLHKAMQGALAALLCLGLMYALPIEPSLRPSHAAPSGAYLPMAAFLGLCALLCCFFCIRRRRKRN